MTTQPARRASNWSYWITLTAIVALIGLVVFFSSATSANESSRAANRHVAALQAQLNRAKAQISGLSANKEQADVYYNDSEFYLFLDRIAAHPNAGPQAQLGYRKELLQLMGCNRYMEVPSDPGPNAKIGYWPIIPYVAQTGAKIPAWIFGNVGKVKIYPDNVGRWNGIYQKPVPSC